MEDIQLVRNRKFLFTTVRAIVMLTGKDTARFENIIEKYQESFNEPLRDVIERSGFKSIFDSASHPDSKFKVNRLLDNTLVVSIESPHGLSEILYNQIVLENTENEQKEAEIVCEGQKNVNHKNDYSTTLEDQPTPPRTISPPKKLKSMPGTAHVPKIFRHASSSSDSQISETKECIHKPFAQVNKMKVVQPKKVNVEPVAQATEKEVSQSKKIDVKPGSKSSISCYESTRVIVAHVNRATADNYSSNSTANMKQAKKVQMVQVDEKPFKLDHPMPSINNNAMTTRGREELLCIEIERELVEKLESSEEVMKLMPAVKRIVRGIFNKLGFLTEK